MNNFIEIALEKISSFSPNIINAVIVFLLGILVARWARDILKAFFRSIRFDQVIKRVGWEDFFQKIHPNFDVLTSFEAITQIFFVLLFLMIASEIIELRIFSQFIEKIIVYSPNIFISMVIFIFTVYLVDFSQKIVVGTRTFKEISYSRFFGRAIDWIIRGLAILAILYQLKIVPQLILVIFIGVVLAIALALGISLGLAGKEPAIKLLKDVKKIFN